MEFFRSLQFFIFSLTLTILWSGQSYAFDFGLASDFHAVRTNDTALTAAQEFGHIMLQEYLIMESQGNSTTYALAANLKATVSGGIRDGFHVGGGMGLRSTSGRRSDTYFNGILGFHFEPASRVSVHVDGGISFANDNNNSSVQIGGDSALWGVSLLYHL